MAGLGAGKGGFPPFVTEWLQKIIQCVRFEGADGVLIVGSDKYRERHRRCANGLNYLQAIQFGHLHIEKDQIQRLASDDLHGSSSVYRFEYASDLRIFCEQIDKALACGCFIIDCENAEWFSGLGHWLALLQIVGATKSPPLFRLRQVAERRSCYFRRDGDRRCVRA